MQNRQITDARVLKAYANPARLRILDALRAYGPATVGALADRLDEAVGSISHHLKLLADAELVEPAPDLARDRRESWWRVPRGRTSWNRTDLEPDAARAALAAEEVALDRQTELFRRAMHTPDPQWSSASFVNTSWFRLTPDQLRQLNDEFTEITTRWAEIGRANDRPGAEPVLVVLRGEHIPDL